jgi:hypothetical protein
MTTTRIRMSIGFLQYRLRDGQCCPSRSRTGRAGSPLGASHSPSSIREDESRFAHTVQRRAPQLRRWLMTLETPSPCIETP